MDDLAARLDAATTAIVELRPAIERGEPWPLTDVYGPGPESSWGPREVLAHLCEMVPFWMGELELIIDARVTPESGEAEPPTFGRLEDDPLRVQIIGRDRAFPARELVARFEVEARRAARRFEALGDDEAGRIGRHVTRGDLSVRDVAERLIVSHAEGHATQLREILATAR